MRDREREITAAVRHNDWQQHHQQDHQRHQHDHPPQQQQQRPVMKKLYAKASFSSKKAQKHAANAEEADEDLKMLQRPILAYQNGTPDAATKSATIERQQQQLQLAARQKVTASAAAGMNGTLRPQQQQAPQQQHTRQHTQHLAAHPAKAPPYEADMHHYYSIMDLENAQVLLDHRHPDFHRQLRAANHYQHQRLVLQLPLAGGEQGGSNNNSNNNGTSSANRLNGGGGGTPIYEAPVQQQHRLTRERSSSSIGAGMVVGGGDDLAEFATLPMPMPMSMDVVEFPINGAATLAMFNGSGGGGVDVAGSSMPGDGDTTTSTLAGVAMSHGNGSHTLPKCAVGTAMASLRSPGDGCSGASLAGGGQAVNGDGVGGSSSFTASALDAYVTATLQRQRLQQQQHLQQRQQLLQRHNSVKENFISDNPAAAAAVGHPQIAYAEQSIIGARASVMVYDDNQKKWVPSGSSSGLSKVQIYHHQQNNTFRVVGRKLQDHEVVINCSILKGLKYNQATATFHQWRDSKFVYGLNFSSQQDAEAFARAMMHALQVLSGRVSNQPGQPTNGNGYEEDMGYRTMTSEDAAILRSQQQITGQVTPSAQTPTSQTNQNNIPQSPPTPQGHHRTSRNSLSAPPAPQPQQMSMPPHQQQPQQQQQQQQPQPQQLYGHTGNGPTTQNGGQQMPPAPVQAGQYQTPQPPPPQQQQQQQQQTYGQPQMLNQGYPQQNHYHQQSHYVLSNSNPNLNLHQYPQQQVDGGASQPPIPPPHQGQNGPIYVASQASHIAAGIPTSASANSVVYASQQQMLHGGGGGVVPSGGQHIPQPPQPPAMPNGPPAPPNVYGQQNGGISHNQSAENLYGQVPMAPPMMPSNSIAPGGVGGLPAGAGNGIPMPPPMNRMSSGPVGVGAPAAPPPPPTYGGAPMFNGSAGNAPPPPQPPAPPAAPPMMMMGGGGAGPGAPPPPPPPPMGGMGKSSDPQADLMGSLAAQLQQAKLKKNKNTPAVTENSGSSTSSGGSGNYGTIGRSSTGMASMMDEMAKTLARRRAQAEKKPEPEADMKQRPWEKSNTLPHKLGGSSSGCTNANSNSNANCNNTSNSGSESPRPIRKRFGSASEETILKVNGDGLSLALGSTELDTLKAEIVREMRAEIQKVKQEIIEAIKSEFNRR